MGTSETCGISMSWTDNLKSKIQSRTFISIFISLCVVIAVISIIHFDQEGRKRYDTEGSESSSKGPEKRKDSQTIEAAEFAKSGLSHPHSRDLSLMFNFLSALMK